jgi:hypothetical protein
VKVTMASRRLSSAGVKNGRGMMICITVRMRI